MAKYLVIVESPAKCKTINKYLGNDYKVMASFGHIREIPSKQGMVDKKDYSTKYDISDSKKKVVKELASNAKGKDIIYLCTDPDREGEGIAWHLMEVLKSRGIKGPFKRVVFHEITKSAILEAFKHARDIDFNLVHAQQARQSLDYLVGFTLSPMLWKSVGKGLSAGRVQSPALKLVSLRDTEIDSFVPEEYWTIHLDSHKENIKYKAKLLNLEGLSGKLVIPNEEDANRIISRIGNKDGRVLQVKKREQRRKPKAPFITSSLQQDAFRKLGMSSKMVMSTAQSLFESGRITYMRTDSTTLSKEATDSIHALILKQFGKDYLYPDGVRTYGKKSANAQEAHEAIRPTNFDNDPESIKYDLSTDEYKLYKLIFDRTVASQMSDAVFNVTSYDIKVGDGIFRCSGSVPVFLGYLSQYEEGREDDEKEDNQKLPELSEGEVVPNDKVYKEQHFTQPPARFNDATLVGKLEELGIGRPSTYASIIDTLKKRQYVDNKQKKMESTNIGKQVADYLEKHFPEYVSYDFTSKLESSLDDIANGRVDYFSVMHKAVSKLDSLVKEESERMKSNQGFTEILDENCPKCNSKLGIRGSKFGSFIACTAYPSCDYKRNMSNPNKTGLEYVGRDCPDCKSKLIKRKSKKGKEFIGCSAYPKCNYVEWPDDGKHKTVRVETDIKCPKCKKHNLILISGKYDPFLGCSSYGRKGSNCKYTEKASDDVIAKYLPS